MVDAGDWESEANERIDRLRKRDVTIQVKLVVMVIIIMMVMNLVLIIMIVIIKVTIEGTDSPSELTLEVDQTDHLFPFGTAGERLNPLPPP